MQHTYEEKTLELKGEKMDMLKSMLSNMCLDLITYQIKDKLLSKDGVTDFVIKIDIRYNHDMILSKLNKDFKNEVYFSYDDKVLELTCIQKKNILEYIIYLIKTDMIKKGLSRLTIKLDTIKTSYQLFKQISGDIKENLFDVVCCFFYERDNVFQSLDIRINPTLIETDLNKELISTLREAAFDRIHSDLKKKSLWSFSDPYIVREDEVYYDEFIRRKLSCAYHHNLIFDCVSLQSIIYYHPKYISSGYSEVFCFLESIYEEIDTKLMNEPNVNAILIDMNYVMNTHYHEFIIGHFCNRIILSDSGDLTFLTLVKKVKSPAVVKTLQILQLEKLEDALKTNPFYYEASLKEYGRLDKVNIDILKERGYAIETFKTTDDGNVYTVICYQG